MSLKKKAQELCLACQYCCKTLAMSVNAVQFSDEMRKFFIARGCELYEDTPEVVWVIMPSVCPNLTTFGCKIYDSRPVVCRAYDGRFLPFMDKKCNLHKLSFGFE